MEVNGRISRVLWRFLPQSLSPMFSRNPGAPETHFCVQHHVGSEDQNSDSNAFTTRTLPAEPAPWSPHWLIKLENGREIDQQMDCPDPESCEHRQRNEESCQLFMSQEVNNWDWREGIAIKCACCSQLQKTRFLCLVSTQQLPTACTSPSMGANDLFWPPQAPVCSWCIQMRTHSSSHTYIQINSNNNQQIFKRHH